MCSLFLRIAVRRQVLAIIKDDMARVKSGKWKTSNEGSVKQIPELAQRDGGLT